MAKVWVKGYTKPDGTKVKGHYREVGSVFVPSRTSRKQTANALRMGGNPEDIKLQEMRRRLNAAWNKKPAGAAEVKRQYGKNLVQSIKEGKRLPKISV